MPADAHLSESHRVIAHATQWLPFGGPSAEDILVTFGVTPSIYFRRLRDVLTSVGDTFVPDDSTRNALVELCVRRIRAGDGYVYDPI